MSTLCIYHAQCADGFGAAYVVMKALGGIEFLAAEYGSEPPDVSGKEVILVDFSYPRDVLLAMAAQAESILILDHHHTAQQELVDLPQNVVAIFDRDHSGAMLAYRHFFPASGTPHALLWHIEDRDLWRFEIPGTREVMAAVFSYPYEFPVWDRLMVTGTSVLAAEGAAILRSQQQDIATILALTRRELVIAGHRVPAANMPRTLCSDAAEAMTEGHLFVALYWDEPDGRKFSLRSAIDGIDVSRIAQQYGGGGHRHAAGFKIGFARAAEFELPMQVDA
jgi:oligoribonuclease NrnB/cAMP/cGMP phosphodiesterase (DHH superfamily)